MNAWDAWLVTLICGQLNSTTAGEWQLRQSTIALPSYVELKSFLSKRVAAFEAGVITNSSCAVEKPNRGKTSHPNTKSFFAHTNETKPMKCPACSEAHKIYYCQKFRDMALLDRRQLISTLRLCFNCLNFGHQVSACRLSACPKCGKKHNSRLHEDHHADTSTGTNANTSSSADERTVLYTETIKPEEPNSAMNVMLATSFVVVNDKTGQPHKCRVVLDSGSQLNFVTNDCAKRLGI